MLLLILILVPFMFSFLCWQSEHINIKMPRWFALIGTSIVFIIVLFLYLYQLNYCQLMTSHIISTNTSSVWQLEYISSWIPRFGINIHLALDGLSLLMLMLSGILGVIAILSSWNGIHHYQGLFYFNLLWILGGTIGFFLAIDMFLLFFFWEIVLIPMFFLICFWGYEKASKTVKIYAATKFFIYAQFSGLCMLVSIISLASFNYRINGIWSFDYEDLLHIQLPYYVEYLLMLIFFLSFAIKMPIVPFHSWLPETHGNTSIFGSVDLIGILIKTAVYGFFRFILPLFPCSSQSFSTVAMVLGLINIFYGSCMAFMQIDIKRLVAYANISHMGLVLIAIYSNSHISYQGSIIQIISYSLSASGLLILCGQLHNRLYTKNINLMGGLWSYMNLMPALFLCFTVAMLGMPGTGNFIGELMILLGNFQKSPIITIIAAFGILFTSIYSIMLMQRIYYGPPSLSLTRNQLLVNMTLREKSIVIILLLCIFTIGLFPQFILNTSYEAMKNIHIRLQEYHNLL